MARLAKDFDFGQRLREGVFQRQGLLSRSSGLALRPLDGAKHGHDAIRHARRRASTEKAKLSHGSDLQAPIHRLAETVAHQTHKRRRRRPCALPGRAHMQDGAARRFYAHNLHRALCVHPRSIGR